MIKGLDKVFERFAITPNDISLYEMAFTHRSYTNEHLESKDYDRLEFLGDSFLDTSIGYLVYDYFKEYDSGQLSKARSFLVDTNMLSNLSENVYHFSELVRYSVGEKNNTKFHKHIDEDVFEAFIGALYLDQGIEKTFEIVKSIYKDLIPLAKDALSRGEAKSKLQAKIGGASVEYKVIKSENLNSENVSYTVQAIYEKEILGVGVGHNIKDAEINAAIDALSKESR